MIESALSQHILCRSDSFQTAIRSRSKHPPVWVLRSAKVLLERQPMHIVSNIALISINETIVVQLVSFLVFLFVINRVMFRPLARTLDEREQYTKTLREEIVQAETELKALTDQIRESEAAAREEALRVAKETELSGNERAGEIFDATRKDVDAQIADAQMEIDAQIDIVRKDMEKESGALASTIMEQLLGRELTQ